MSKLCNYGFCVPIDTLTPKQITKIKNELNVKPESNFGNFSVKSFKVYRETKKYFILPVYYSVENFKFDYEVILPEYDTTQIEDSIILHESQVKCYDMCRKEIEKLFGGGIINLSTGSGKTIIAIKLACFFKLKTLIIVNKIELLNQWKKEIVKWVPNVKIGIIQGGTFEYEDCDIVLGMLQTISMKSTLEPIDFSWAGLCFIDEVHNLGSEIFSQLLFKIRPKYLFGLTATLERKDKLEKVIRWFLGNVIYSNISSDLKQTTEVHVYKYKGKSSVSKQLRDGTAAVARMLSNIGEDKERSNMIADVVRELIADKERQVLVISDRVSQLKYLHDCIEDRSGLFIGSMKNKDLELSKDKQVILGTYPLVNEGFNLPKLNCLVFATPRSSITQAVGRIYRKKHYVTPIIVDIFDDFSIFTGQHYRRRTIYKKSIENCRIINKTNHEEPEEKSKVCLILDDD